jgi:hypothetical protein
MTSIEWLDEQIQEYVISVDHVANTMVIKISFEEYMDLKRQSKEMHKQEIIDAYETSHISMMTSEQYYQETFVSKGSGMSEKPNNHIEAELPKQEISDEEIEKAFTDASERLSEYKEGLIDGAKWYREQLKQL